MFKLKRFLHPYKKQLIIGPFFKLMEAILELLIPWMMVYVIDIGVKSNDKSYVIKMGFLMLAICVVGLICALICQYSASIASQGFGTNLRNYLYQHLNAFSLRESDKFGTSSLVNRLVNDVNVLQQAVAMLIRLVIRAPFICIGSLVMAMLLDFKLSMIILLSFPLFVGAIYIIMSKTIPLYKKVQGKLDQYITVIRENLSGVRVIRAFSKTAYERERFDTSNTDYVETAVHVGKISALLNPITMLIMNFAIIAILWFGGIRIDEGYMTQGEIVAFINYISYMITALIVVANLIILFTRAAASGARVNEVLDTQATVLDNEKQNHPAGNPDNVIEFQNVTFAYGDVSVPVLEDISFCLRKGETLGIIGSTGSGKSTLVHLIPRFYDVTSGQVLFAGKDVRDYPQKVLRDKIGMALQKTELFSGTISENIRLGKENATDDEVRHAAQDAQAMEFIENMPKAFDTYVERGGANLSGGQKQRLNIARALVREPELLILDDSSSALDYATEAALRRELKRFTKENGMSTIIVSQRISSVRDADKILVLDDGKTAGIGTHTELLENCAVYREICDSQNTEKEGD